MTTSSTLIKASQAALQESEMRRRFGAPHLMPAEQERVKRDTLEALIELDDNEGADNRTIRLSAQMLLGVISDVSQ